MIPQSFTRYPRAISSEIVSISFTTLAYRHSTRYYSWTPHSFKSLPENTSLKKTCSKSREKKLAFIALGSNMGDRVRWIEEACTRMSRKEINLKRTSSLWETKPMYVLSQGNFLNGVCEVETKLSPLDLLDELQDIERELGRVKTIDKGPRNIDLDILLYDDELVNHNRLQIPHPGISEREFVLRPLSELIPEKPLYSSSPWKLTRDYLNSLPVSNISTVSPLADNIEPIYPLRPDRQTKIMAILNVSPESFSNERNQFQVPSRKETNNIIDRFVNLKASIIDIGGQSSQPSAKNISFEEEINRITPAIEYARQQRMKSSNITKFAISVDTYRAKVAEAAVKCGADIINDVSAGTLDPEMLPTVAKLGKTICLTHMRGTPDTMSELTDYSEGLIPTIARELIERIEAAEAAGIKRWRIILDPGIGFAKTVNQNLEILRKLEELKDWPGLQGFPWLIGSSRKRFIGNITGVKIPNERIWGTSATVAAAIIGGADIIRVHDVEEMSQVARMSDAIWRI
ncbi:Folic acid synthesis protein fol1 [Golovinomyces cichoracearum]|uniref:Folic acid synthesis protein FOL1 n=1 Tax=Golovinomyces cichoracearum TaxID=62708 RepID=A0A420HEY3_9PEZI|nr:Folic acid synthesis protein fol1 [Golovinomyces cichoracearum]